MKKVKHPEPTFDQHLRLGIHILVNFLTADYGHTKVMYTYHNHTTLLKCSCGEIYFENQKPYNIIHHHE